MRSGLDLRQPVTPNSPRFTVGRGHAETEGLEMTPSTSFVAAVRHEQMGEGRSLSDEDGPVSEQFVPVSNARLSTFFQRRAKTGVWDRADKSSVALFVAFPNTGAIQPTGFSVFERSPWPEPQMPRQHANLVDEGSARHGTIVGVVKKNRPHADRAGRHEIATCFGGTGVPQLRSARSMN